MLLKNMIKVTRKGHNTFRFLQEPTRFFSKKITDKSFNIIIDMAEEGSLAIERTGN